MSNLCHHPFTSVDITSNGTLRPCCKFMSRDLPEFNIKDGLDAYEKSQWLSDLRESFVKNEKPRGCERCWKEEDAGFESKRQMDKSILGHIDLDGFMDLPPEKRKLKYLSISFGNLCNLACRICGAHSSSRWASEMKKLNPDLKLKDLIYKWHQDPVHMQDIYEKTKEVIHVDVVGGEPMLTEIPEHFDLLNKMKKEGQTKDTELHYTTNATTYPSDANIDIWKAFKKVEIQMSIDDTGERFEYNRWPANWDQVYRNIKKYQKLAYDNDNIQLSISHSLSAFTILYQDEFHTWCIRQGLPLPWVGLITDPYYYRVNIFNDDIQQKIREKLSQSKIKQVRQIEKHLIPNNDPNLMTAFRNFVSVFDEQRNQSFQKTFPELAELIRY